MSKAESARPGEWQRKRHKHWRGSSIWHHLRLGRGISLNVWTMKGLDHHVIEFGAVTERAPKGLADAKRSALRLVRALCLAAAQRAEEILRTERVLAAKRMRASAPADTRAR